MPHFIRPDLVALDLLIPAINTNQFYDVEDVAKLRFVCNVGEDMEDDLSGVHEMKRVCKRDGQIVLTVPAYLFLWSHHDIVNHHFRRYTLKSLKELAKKSGLFPVRATFFNTILFIPIAIFRLLSKMIPDKIIRKGAGSDATLHTYDGLISRILYRIFSWELSLLKLFNLPFGVSIFVSLSKNNS